MSGQSRDDRTRTDPAERSVESPAERQEPSGAGTVATAQVSRNERAKRHLESRMPRNRWARMGLGAALVAGGILGFLPILGFWMIPLGLFVLSYDLPAAERLRHRLERWWRRRGNRDG